MHNSQIFKPNFIVHKFESPQNLLYTIVDSAAEGFQLSSEASPWGDFRKFRVDDLGENGVLKG